MRKSKKKQIISHQIISLGENLWRIKEKPPFLNVRGLITREIMRRKDAHGNTNERA